MEKPGVGFAGGILSEGFVFGLSPIGEGKGKENKELPAREREKRKGKGQGQGKWELPGKGRPPGVGFAGGILSGGFVFGLSPMGEGAVGFLGESISETVPFLVKPSPYSC